MPSGRWPLPAARLCVPASLTDKVQHDAEREREREREKDRLAAAEAEAAGAGPRIPAARRPAPSRRVETGLGSQEAVGGRSGESASDAKTRELVSPWPQRFLF